MTAGTKLVFSCLKPLVKSFLKESGTESEIFKAGGDCLLSLFSEQTEKKLKEIFKDPTMADKLCTAMQKEFLSIDRDGYSGKFSTAWDDLMQQDAAFETEEDLVQALVDWSGKNLIAARPERSEIKRFVAAFFQKTSEAIHADKELEQYFLLQKNEAEMQELLARARAIEQNTSDAAKKADIDRVIAYLKEILAQMAAPKPAADPVITIDTPVRPSVFFQGRDDDLQKIRALAGDKIVLLNGIGGIGKTEICRRIFWDYRDALTDGVEHLGWITYDNSLCSSLHNKFPAVTAPDPESYQEAVRQLIGQLGKKLLLFIDNANELQPKEAEWLDALPCRMILTSRTAIGRFEKYPVDQFPPDICLKFYQEIIGDQSPEDVPYIEEIIKRAAYHTLTVELLAKTQAAACMTAPDLLEKLQTSGFSLADVMETVERRNDDDNRRLIEHLAIVFDIAQIGDPEALRILKLFSLLAPNTPIAAQTLKGWMQFSDMNAVNDLVQRGWLNKSRSGGLFLFSIHPVIAETVRYKCEPDYAFAEPLLEKLTDALDASSGTGVEKQNALLPHCAAAAEALQGTETDGYARFLNKTATIIQDETGDYSRALLYLKEAVRVSETVNGTEHPNTATSYNNIAVTYYYLGDYDKALGLLKKALDIKEKVLGSEHPDTATTYNNIATLYQDMGDLPMALEYHEKALVIKEKVLGIEHTDTAVTYDNIALLYHDMGNYDMALEFFEKALAIREKMLGKEHPYTAATYNNIARVYSAKGDLQMALDLYEEALAIREKVLGKEHPSTATTYNNIAVPYQDMGDYDMALEFFGKALGTREEMLGKEHPYTAATYNNIAGVYKAKGDLQMALDLYEEALAINEKRLGSEHPDTATIHNNIATVYHDMGDYDMALEFHKKAHVIREKVLGKEHPDVAQTYNNIAVLYQDMGDYDRALEFFEKALAIREKVMGTDHPNTAATYNNIAGVYKAKGDLQMALDLYEEALAIREKVLGKEHPNVAQTYNNIAVLYQDMGDYDRALEFFEKALAIREKVMGTDHPDTAATYNNIASLYHAIGDFPKALDFFEKALAIREKVLGKEHPSTATTYNNIASLYHAMGDFPKALDFFEKALAIREKVLSKKHPNTVKTYENIAALYLSMGDLEKAVEYRRKAGDID